jgi:hypothetical protein
LNEQIANYIRENRDRYTREAITDQLMKAGHDPGAIEEAWAMSDAAVASAADARPRYRRVTVALLTIGGLATFVIWSDLYAAGAGGLATLSYLITGLVAIGVGIGLTRVASGRAWAVAVGLGVVTTLGLLTVTVSNLSDGYDAPRWAALALTAVATAVAYALHRDPGGLPILAYALPVLGWLAVTGICVSPLLTGG